MKIAFITDTHLGARNGSQVFRDLFRSYYEEVFFPYLEENKIDTICHLGDFFDDRSKLGLHDIDYVINEFLPLLDKYNVNLFVVAGNHDVAYRNTNKISSLSLLKVSERVTVIDELVTEVPVQGNYKIYLCPWLNSENYEENVELIKTYANKQAIIGGHFEIAGALMYKNSKACEHGEDQNLFKKYHKALSGHFHHNSTYGNVEYIGALFHYNWQDWNDWRGFTVFDTDSGKFEKVENEYCLFHQYDYEDIKYVDASELSELVECKIVRVQIFNEYSKVELKDLIASIESCKPVSLDIIDNTIIENAVVNEQQEVEDSKEVSDYFKQAIESVDDTIIDKKELTSLFDDLYTRAKDKMKEIV